MTGDPCFEKWDTVLGKLWRQSRFTSYFYQAVTLVPNERLPTLALAVSNHRFLLFFNPDFVLKNSTDHLIGLLVHEMLHVILNHEHRARPGQDIHLRNLAQDMVVNSYLKAHERTFFSRKEGAASAALVLPPGLPEIPAAFGKRPGRASVYDVTWEEVYVWLQAGAGDQDRKRQDDAQAGEQQWPGLADWQAEGRNSDADSPSSGLRFVDGKGRSLPTGIHLFGTTESGRRARAGAERILGFIQKKEECLGERLYADISGLLTQPPAAKSLKWKSAIKTIADQATQTNRWDYSFSRLNRRFFDAGIYAPGRYFRRKPLITMVVDVSGSMTANPGEIEAAFGAVEDLTHEYRINLLCIDQDLFVPRKQGRSVLTSGKQGHYLYQRGDWRYIKSGSRGATFFAPLFNDYMKNHTEALVVITDGQIYDLDALQPYSPTLWVIPGQRTRSFAPSFGRVMDMGGVA